MNYKRIILPAVLLIFVTGCSNIGIDSRPEPTTSYGQYFDTLISITVYNSDDAEHLAECFRIAEYYESIFSKTKNGSDIYRINQAEGAPVTVEPETILLIRKALSYSRLSDGSFDITIGALSRLWDIQSKEIPDDTSIRDALATISYQNIVIDGNQIILQNPKTQLDLGGIAKGYIADKIKEYLVAQGVAAGIINLGGNVLAIGEKQDGTAFSLGIQKPFSAAADPLAAVSIRDKAVVTSGIYERYFEKDAVIYHHILDTATGYPVQNNLFSVTIIGENSADADALSTICYSFGLEKGLAFIESRPDTEAIFITDDYEIHATKGIGETIPFRKLSP